MNSTWICQCDRATYPACKGDLYDTCHLKGNCRYVVGQEEPTSQRTLACIGINPSSAKPHKLDQTVLKVQQYAVDNNYDSWIMLNLYPLRNGDQTQLPPEADTAQYAKNLEFLKHYLVNDKVDVWCAWGSGVKSYTYLKRAVNALLDFAPHNKILIQSPSLTTCGNPRHPSPRFNKKQVVELIQPDLAVIAKMKF